MNRPIRLEEVRTAEADKLLEQTLELCQRDTEHEYERNRLRHRNNLILCVILYSVMLVWTMI